MTTQQKSKFRVGQVMFDKRNKRPAKILSTRGFPIIWVFETNGNAHTYQVGAAELRPLKKSELKG
jgi:hypothetical protein